MSEIREPIYKGKAKSIYSSSEPHKIILHFRDDATAFNGEKKAVIENKGKINNQFNAFIMHYLQENGIPTHFEKLLNTRESLAKAVQVIPVECVVRNRVAGSLSKRLGIPEGGICEPPIFDFFLKSDELGDPLINMDHILFLKLATQEELEKMRALSLRINELLSSLFLKAGLLLVDFKLEFGRFEDQILLADEITPDGCRIWDAETQKKLDKDIFRRDLGNLIEGYEEVCRRIEIPLNLD